MAQALVIPPLVESVGASGQISLGKEYAGRQVLVEMPAEAGQSTIGMNSA